MLVPCVVNGIGNKRFIVRKNLDKLVRQYLVIYYLILEKSYWSMGTKFCRKICSNAESKNKINSYLIIFTCIPHFSWILSSYKPNIYGDVEIN